MRTPLAAALLYASRLGLDGISEADRRGTSPARSSVACGTSSGWWPTCWRSPAAAAAASVAATSARSSRVRHRASRLGSAAGALTIRTLAPGLAIVGNAEALVGALVNLAINALDAVGDGDAHVEIEASARDGRAVIRVTDNGPGIPAEFHCKIFEPFFTTRSSGTGLGLAVVKSVALAHGGSVRVEDAAVGACFVLELPALGADA